MNFEKWLITQKDRQDPVGDLACDYIKAREIIRKPYQNRSDDSNDYDIVKQMRTWRACFEAYSSLTEASKEHAILFPEQTKKWTEEETLKALNERYKWD